MLSSKIILFFPKSEEQDTVLLPSSVLMVAAPLVKNGEQVKIIDQRVNQNWQTELLQEIKGGEVLIFGVSALTGRQISNGLVASKLVKKHSNIPVVWGGVHASLLPQQTLFNQFIDLVVIGEGEATFLELVEALKTNGSLTNIKGFGYKKNGKIFLNSRREFIDLNKLPEIPYHLVNIENYISQESFATGRPARDIAFYTSRGCPHRCGFCYNQEFNQRKWRSKSAEKIVEEIKELVNKYDITALNIEDDEFFVDIERARRICQLIIQADLNLEIYTSCRVDYVANQMDNDYLVLLYRAGFRTLSFGIESGSTKILELIHKDITKKQVMTTITKLKKAGINSKYCFMAGFPKETIDDLYQTTDLIQTMKQADPQIRIPAWRIFTPYPGTDLYDLAIQQGWQPPNNLSEWANYNFQTVKMPWVDNRRKRIIKNIAWMINYLEMGQTRGHGIFFELAKIFGRLVDWRWRNHFFSWLPEKYLIKLILRIKKLILS